ncbi:vitamin K epoxide reductase family protein [Glycomyces buryatensis]|uniref:Vitamin K epoxide reductase family protein n=1 Tax=Glycomyces buryatensis TaxID=2570927 RepID=A0A4S8Q9S6_9ACTN|nr:vitamin K epoxide reductase family protein [Glycomyces buryatensis]THV41088.1 vitamin K epoxide reductase family protein [Glycomyces buryatensis]
MTSTAAGTAERTAGMDEAFGDDPRASRSRLATGLIQLLGGIIGLVASFDLSYERVASLLDPGHVISCDFNPVLSCGTVMNTWQASVFGFPNPYIGLMAFPFVIFMGVLTLARVALPRWVNLTFNLGTLGGLVFISWLIIQTSFLIGVLCPWCMVVWAVVIPIFWFTTVDNLRTGAIGVGEDWRGAVDDLLRFHWIGLAVLYLAVLAIIGMAFWDYWSTLF